MKNAVRYFYYLTFEQYAKNRWVSFGGENVSQVFWRLAKMILVVLIHWWMEMKKIISYQFLREFVSRKTAETIPTAITNIDYISQPLHTIISTNIGP